MSNPHARLIAVDVAKQTLIDSTRERIKARTLLTLDPELGPRIQTLYGAYSEVTVPDVDQLQSDIIHFSENGNLVVAANVTDLAGMSTGFADAGIALNAVVYVPFEMLRGLRATLKMDLKLL